MSEGKFISLHKVEPREVEWLWKPYIPRGCLSIFEGDPDVGKSYLAMNLAALVTIGGQLPGGQTLESGRVLYVASEDDAALTLRPRIDRMGGDSRKVRILEGLLVFDEDGIDKIRREMERHPADLSYSTRCFRFFQMVLTLASQVPFGVCFMPLIRPSSHTTALSS